MVLVLVNYNNPDSKVTHLKCILKKYFQNTHLLLNAAIVSLFFSSPVQLIFHKTIKNISVT